MFQNKKYRGHNFLLLQNLNRGIVQPTYAKGGSWLDEEYPSRHMTISL